MIFQINWDFFFFEFWVDGLEVTNQGRKLHAKKAPNRNDGVRPGVVNLWSITCIQQCKENKGH